MKHKFKQPLFWVTTIILLTIAIIITLNIKSPPTPAITFYGIYYVAPEGDNVNRGTLEAPFQTIQRCLDVVEPGDTCLIREGTYYESLVLRTGGTEGERITIQNYNGETVTINSGTARTLRTDGRRDSYTFDGLRFITTGSGGNGDEGSLSFGNGVWDGNSTKTGGNNGFILRNCYVEGAVSFYGHGNMVENCELNGKRRWDNGIWDRSGVSYDNVYRNNRVHGYTRRGIWTMEHTENILIENNTIYDVGQMGIDCDGAGSPVYDCRVIGNTIYDIGPEWGVGIFFENSFSSVAAQNKIYDCDWGGINFKNYGTGFADAEYRDKNLNTIVKNNVIYNTTYVGIGAESASGVKVYNNTIYNVSGSQWFFGAFYFNDEGDRYTGGSYGSNNWVIKNNVIAKNDSYGFYFEDLSKVNGLVSSNNLYHHPSKQETHFDKNTERAYTLGEFQAIGGQESNSLFGEPGLVSPETEDFHLQPDSLAVDAGVSLPEVRVDFEGMLRPQGIGYDIGADEIIDDLLKNNADK
jgi:hypothetical protein